MLIMEQEKYNLLLSILRDYYGQQQQRGGFPANPEHVAGELASLISTVVGSDSNGQSLYPIAPPVTPYVQNPFPMPQVDAGPPAWPTSNVREPVPESADRCIHRLHDIAERASRDIATLRRMLGDRPVRFATKVSPIQSMADLSSEYGDDEDIKRKRNREAQKRFRDRQKRKKNDLESEFLGLCHAADQLEEANIALEQRLYLEMKTVAVSEVILLAFEGQVIESNSILNFVLSEEEKKRCMGDGKEVENGTAELQRLPSAPKELESFVSHDISPELKRIYQKAYQIKNPDSLYLYYREWQIESQHLHSRSEKDNTSEELMVSRMNELYQVWMINLLLYPDNFARVFADNYPPPDQADKLWMFISGELYKSMEKKQILNLQKEFKKYKIVADRVEKEVDEAWKKLEELGKAFDGAVTTMRGASAIHLRMVSQAQTCESLAKQSWNNAVDFAPKWVACIGNRNAFLCNTFASPYTVDWITMSKMLLDMAKSDGVVVDTNK